MESKQIIVAVTVGANADKAWDCYTNPAHIVHWNFADPSWHCPSASNDLQVGGWYHARMEARDGSFGFDFGAVYEALEPGKSFTYLFGDRRATVVFNSSEPGQTTVTVSFDPEQQNPAEMQRGGWQAILDNYKKYTEAA